MASTGDTGRTEPTLPSDEIPIGGKPYHGWSCDCPEECARYVAAGLPRPGELG